MPVYLHPLGTARFAVVRSVGLVDAKDSATNAMHASLAAARGRRATLSLRVAVPPAMAVAAPAP